MTVATNVFAVLGSVSFPMAGFTMPAATPLTSIAAARFWVDFILKDGTIEALGIGMVHERSMRMLG